MQANGKDLLQALEAAKDKLRLKDTQSSLRSRAGVACAPSPGLESGSRSGGGHAAARSGVWVRCGAWASSPASLPAQPLNVASAPCASFLARQISARRSTGQHLNHHHQHQQHLASTTMRDVSEMLSLRTRSGVAFLVHRQPFGFSDSKL